MYWMLATWRQRWREPHAQLIYATGRNIAPLRHSFPNFIKLRTAYLKNLNTLPFLQAYPWVIIPITQNSTLYSCVIEPNRCNTIITVFLFLWKIYALYLGTRWLEGTGLESLVGCEISTARPDRPPDAHPASFTMGIGSSPGVRRPAGRGVVLVTYPHLASKLKKE